MENQHYLCVVKVNVSKIKYPLKRHFDIPFTCRHLLYSFLVCLPCSTAELHHNHSVTPTPHRKLGKKCDGKGSRGKGQGDHSTIIVMGKTDSA